MGGSPTEGILACIVMTEPRIDAPFLRRAVTAALACACLGAPVSAQDGAKSKSLPAATASVAAVGLPGEAREIRALRDPQVIVTRLPQTGAVVASIAEDAVAAPGTMLLVLAAMMLWIAGRRR
ncbi:MAG: hypothetical protein ACK5PW_22770 [Burkholderiales bacterium]